MNRDGENESLWQFTMPEYVPKHAHLPTTPIDVVVVGGGITGLATALALQKGGKKCALLESHNIGFGTTGGTTAHLNTFFDTTYAQVADRFGAESAKLLLQAAEQALALIKGNIDTYQIDCEFEYKDAYLFAQNDDEIRQLEDLTDGAERAGLQMPYTGQLPVTLSFERAAVVSNQAQFHPAKYIYGLAKAFEEAGGVLLQHCMVQSFEEKELIELQTALGSLKTKQLIWATHIPSGINVFSFRCAPYRSYAIAVQVAPQQYPKALVYDLQDPYHYYRTQIVNGEPYLIFGGEDHKTGHDEHAADHFTNLEAYLRQYFDVQQVCFRWSSQYFEPTDGLAYIGHMPGHSENVFVATGFGGNGMTYSHIAANLFSDVILKGRSQYSEVFNPARLKPVTGFSNFIKENADVVKEFIGKRMSVQKIGSLAAIAKGEGRVVSYEGETVALYRNMNDELHAIDPVCKHAGCIVQWNNAEKTWDCPCHGARYSIEGTLLTGPATKDLEVVKLKE
ncbi:MAG: FAD-dependent oxidoreductase [Flavipsychrobacter sp.]|nr:FAD-dependent oxidoreductase [Flavipsychrobacter sp.]